MDGVIPVGIKQVVSFVVVRDTTRGKACNSDCKILVIHAMILLWSPMVIVARRAVCLFSLQFNYLVSIFVFCTHNTQDVLATPSNCGNVLCWEIPTDNPILEFMSLVKSRYSYKLWCLYDNLTGITKPSQSGPFLSLRILFAVVVRNCHRETLSGPG